MTNRPRTLILVGSLRKGSINRGLARAIAAACSERLEAVMFELHGIPLYNGDLEAAGDPAAVAALKAAVAECQGLIIVSPEYNGGLPGVVKNALDWASRPPRPLRGKPLAWAGASPGSGGTLGSQLGVPQLGRNLGMLAWPGPDLRVGGAPRAIGPDGSVLDEKVAERITRFAHGVADWIERVG